MSAPIPLRRDFGASQLRGLAKKTKDGPQARRLLALAAIYDGGPVREECAEPNAQPTKGWLLNSAKTRWLPRGSNGTPPVESYRADTASTTSQQWPP